jgi:hypothetical protein
VAVAREGGTSERSESEHQHDKQRGREAVLHQIVS